MDNATSAASRILGEAIRPKRRMACQAKIKTAPNKQTFRLRTDASFRPNSQIHGTSNALYAGTLPPQNSKSPRPNQIVLAQRPCSTSDAPGSANKTSSYHGTGNHWIVNRSNSTKSNAQPASNQVYLNSLGLDGLIRWPLMFETNLCGDFICGPPPILWWEKRKNKTSLAFKT